MRGILAAAAATAALDGRANAHFTPVHGPWPSSIHCTTIQLRRTVFYLLLHFRPLIHKELLRTDRFQPLIATKFRSV